MSRLHKIIPVKWDWLAGLGLGILWWLGFMLFIEEARSALLDPPGLLAMIGAMSTYHFIWLIIARTIPVVLSRRGAY